MLHYNHKIISLQLIPAGAAHPVAESLCEALNHIYKLAFMEILLLLLRCRFMKLQ